nr:MAG TPA: endonuclease [Caudoviricetes sp.]
MKKAFKYRIYPNKAQRALFQATFGCCRFVYNKTLDIRKTAYAMDKTQLSEFDLIKKIKPLKEEFPWLRDVPAVCLPQAVGDMNDAFRDFFKSGKGYPKFKTKHRSRKSCRFPGQSCAVLQDISRLKLPKLGLVKYKKDREFIGTLRHIVITQESNGKYYASCLVDTGVEAPNPKPVEASTTVGIDLGLKDFIVTSDGCKMPNPRFYVTIDHSIARLQKHEARKMKGSKRRARIRLKINKLCVRKRNLIKNYIYHVAKTLLRESQTLVMEDLNIGGMVKNHSLAKSIQNICWGELRRVLEYKSQWLGHNLIFIDRWAPSTKTCSHCGFHNSTLTLSDRSWTCPGCGTHHDRDINAAINIKRMGLETLLPAVSGFDGRGEVGYGLDEASICASY